KIERPNVVVERYNSACSIPFRSEAEKPIVSADIENRFALKIRQPQRRKFVAKNFWRFNAVRNNALSEVYAVPPEFDGVGHFSKLWWVIGVEGRQCHSEISPERVNERENVDAAAMSSRSMSFRTYCSIHAITPPAASSFACMLR